MRFFKKEIVTCIKGSKLLNKGEDYKVCYYTQNNLVVVSNMNGWPYNSRAYKESRFESKQLEVENFL